MLIVLDDSHCLMFYVMRFTGTLCMVVIVLKTESVRLVRFSCFLKSFILLSGLKHITKTTSYLATLIVLFGSVSYYVFGLVKINHENCFIH